MKNIFFLITIIRRADAEEYEKFYADHGVGILYSLNCNGTAHERTLSLLGIEKSEKTMLFTIVSGEMLKNALDLLAKRKAKHFNIDLIYGVAQVPWEVFAADLDQAIGCGADHLSCYSLTTEENSQLGLASPVADDASSADWWLKLGEVLCSGGFERYEISNYACPGCGCKHNLNVWRGDTLLGVGAAAAGFNGRDRYNFAPDIKSFINGEAPEWDVLPEKDRLLEIFAVNLRTTRGWQQQEWEDIYPGSWAAMLRLSRRAAAEYPDFWSIDDRSIKLTEQGLLFWDDAAAEVLDWVDDL